MFIAISYLQTQFCVLFLKYGNLKVHSGSLQPGNYFDLFSSQLVTYHRFDMRPSHPNRPLTVPFGVTGRCHKPPPQRLVPGASCCDTHDLCYFD